MIVITGGAGFIGSNLAAALERRGEYDLALVDRLGRDEKWRNIAGRELAAIVPPHDLFGFLDQHAAEIDVVFHMGAISTTTERDADLIADTNVTLTARLWEWCAWRGARLIYASSAATYGDGSAGFDDDGSPAALARLRPLNAYGWSKHVVDRRIARLIETDAAAPGQWVGLKFFNVYGPNEYHKGAQQSVVAHLYGQIAGGRTPRLFRSHHPDYADGGQLRDFVWVGDCIDLILFFYDRPDLSGLFNCGTGQARSFLDLAHAVFAAIGRQPEIEFIDTPAELREKYQYFTQAETVRLRSAGFTAPFTSLEDGVGRYVREFLASATPYV